MSLLDFDEFKWRAMTTAINEIKPAGSLVKDLVFPDATPSPSEYIDVDVTIGGRKIAPFVTPIQGGIVVDKMREEIRSVRAPRIRLKKPFTAYELLTGRTPGSGFYAQGGNDLQAYRRKKVGDELNDLKNNRIANTIEWMCCQALTGTLTYSASNLSFVIDFQMPAAHKITLSGTDLWSHADSNPADNFDDWANLIINALGIGPDIAIFGTTAAKKFRDNTKVQTQLDNRRIEIGQNKWDVSSNYFGTYNGVKCYKYGTNYDDLNDADQTFWHPSYVALIATSARFSVEYGNILDLDAGANVTAQYFAKSYMQPDPSSMWVLAESRPLPVPWQPQAVVYAYVTA